MKTKGDCMALFLRYLDEATRKGIDIPATKNADYKDKFNYFLNEAQIYVAQIIKIPALFQITQNPILNQLGLNQGFAIKQYLPGSDIVFTQAGTKSYYLEMDNVGTVNIAVNGVTVKTINNTAKKQFTAYKGNINALVTDVVTITFTGNYPYNIRNIAMFPYAFPSDEDVPDYTPYVTYLLPTDFLKFDTMIIKTDPKVYEAYVAYRWENNKKIILKYDDIGSFDIHYWKYPTAILPTDPDGKQLDVEDKAIDLVVLQSAIMSTSADNQPLSAWLRSMFGEKVQNITGAESISETSVQTVYSMMG